MSLSTATQTGTFTEVEIRDQKPSLAFADYNSVREYLKGKPGGFKHRVDPKLATTAMKEVQERHSKVAFDTAIFSRAWKMVSAIVRFTPGNVAANTYYMLKKLQQWAEERIKPLRDAILENELNAAKGIGVSASSTLVSFLVVPKSFVKEDKFSQFVEDYDLSPSKLESFRKKEPMTSMKEVDVKAFLEAHPEIEMTEQEFLSVYFQMGTRSELNMR